MVARLRAAPVTVPMLAAAAVVAWWAIDRGGFAVGSWALGGLGLVGLLAVTWGVLGLDVRGVPRLVLVAVGALAGCTLWSFASIAWADDPGFAYQGATRTLLYLTVFCLFALWGQRAETAAWVLGALVAAAGAAAIVTLVRLLGDPGASALLGTGRLKAPTGYPNATAALLLMGALPALVLAAGRGVAPWVRGVLAAIAVLEVGLSLLAVSRGAIYSSPVVLIALFLVVPGRLRMLAVLAPVAVAVAACARRLVDVGDAINADGDPRALTDAAVHPLLVAAGVTGAVVAGVALLAALAVARRPPRPATVRRVQRGIAVAVACALAAGLVGGLAVVGNPADRVSQAWDSFRGGYAGNDADRNRLVAGLGSNRYDFYRVALATFRDHPVGGVGADGFYQEYLRRGRSAETPRYPHSLELRALAQTGVVGAALLLVALVAAFAAALRAAHARDGLQAAAAGGAVVGAFYWVVHGSLDWFWEWAGLGTPAFALLGLACSLAPRRAEATAPVGPPRPRRSHDRRDSAARPSERRASTPGARVAGAAVALLLALPFMSLWAADRATDRATASFAQHPRDSYRLLDRAARLDPFSARPATLEGSIALRLDDLPRADAAFGRALERVPDDAYATLERGAVASARGDRPRALVLLGRAVALAPRDALSREALRIVREGGRIDVAELNRRIFGAARRLAS